MIFGNLVKGNENELSIILVKIGSAQDTATEEESFKVYKKYQGMHPTLYLVQFISMIFVISVAIHKDKPEETSIKSWTRFLRRNPFREDESTFLGLYHCHYRLNGKSLSIS